MFDRFFPVRLMSAVAGILLVIAVARPVLSDDVSAAMLRLDRSAIVVPSDDDPRRGPCYCPVPSQRNLLHRDREAWHRPPRLTAGASIPVTLRVAAIRVAFPYEEPDDPLTTGRGVFDLRDTLTYRDENGHNFDSAPHNRRYFATHMRALHLYWNTVSNGEVSLDWTVFPSASDSAYTMPRSIAYYGRERAGDSGIVFGLEQFVRDAATVAAADPELSFGDFDAVIIFHAGSDRQSDIARNTPYDLFTGFVHLAEPVRVGATELSEAIIMPETVIQDNRITVLNSVMAHEFGHQLGLVDLYSTRSFLTQVGNFSLMDNNVADVGVDVAINGRRRILFGALPVYPDAWSRMYLGFVTPGVVTAQTGALVPAAEQHRILPQTTPQVVKIPISNTEYYLVENRRFDIDGLGDAALRLDTVTSIVLEPVDTLTVTGNREYDFLLPGAGALIWHIDEGVAELDYVTDDDIPNNFLANTLQWDSDRRFVRLVEADGLVNFGGYFSAGTGSRFDYFYDPNNTRLDETTNPPAISNTGAKTGIRIENISRPGLTMTFDVIRTGVMSGFPAYVGAEKADAGAPVISDLTPSGGGQWRIGGDGAPEIFAAYKHYILACDWLGVPLAGPAMPDTVLAFDTSVVVRTVYPVAMGDPDDGGWLSPPMIVDRGAPTGTVVAVSRLGRVYAWDMSDSDQDGFFDVIVDRQTSRLPSGPPVVWNGGEAGAEVFVPIQGHRFEIIRLSGGDRQVVDGLPGDILAAAGSSRAASAAVLRTETREWFVGSVDAEGVRVRLDSDSLLPPARGDVDRDGLLETAVLDVRGRLWLLDDDLEIMPGYPVDLGATAQRPPVLADLDRNGYLDVMAVGDGYLFAFGRNGVSLPNFPVLVGKSNAPDSLAAAPVIADFGSGDRLSLLTAGMRRAVFGYDGAGYDLDGMPRPLGDVSASPVAWAQNETAGQAAVFARSGDGYLYAFGVPYVAAPARPVWLMDAHDPGRTATVPVDDLDSVRATGEFFEAERAFVYPNPASDEAIVRYWLGDDASVRIRIFDLAGNLVTENDGPGNGGLYNEWTWNCANAASGVYFAHIEVTETVTGRKETVLCKMAVVQ